MHTSLWYKSRHLLGILTECFVSDDHAVNHLLKQIDADVVQLTAYGAYDKNLVYDMLATAFPDADIIIPPDSDAIYSHYRHKK